MSTISFDSDKPANIDGIVMRAFSGDKPMGEATGEELLNGLGRHIRKTENDIRRLEEDNARQKSVVMVYTKKCSELSATNKRLTQESEKLKAADAERKQLKVRNEILEEENSELRGRIARMEAEMKKLKADKADAAPRRGRTGTVQQRNFPLSDITSARRADSAPEHTGPTIEEILGWAEEHMEKDPAKRAQIKSMIYDLCRDKLTGEQKAMLDAFDKREPHGQGDVRIEVKDGGVYNESVGRMNVNRRSMGRRSAAANDDFICYCPEINA